MILEKFINKYKIEVNKGIEDLINLAKEKMIHTGYLLVCQQNGFIESVHPAIGGAGCRTSRLTVDNLLIVV